MANVDLLDIIREIILNETLYLRHYWGEVKDNNSLASIGLKGYVKATVPEIGWNTSDKAPWCAPRDKNSLLIPKVGDYVEVYFMAGDRDRPVYLGKVNELAKEIQGDQLPESFDGQPTTQIIYESPQKKEGIKHDELTDVYSVGAGTEAFVKGTTLQPELQKDITAMTTLQAALTAWVPVPNDGGAALKLALAGFLALPMGSVTNMNSVKIKGE